MCFSNLPKLQCTVKGSKPMNYTSMIQMIGATPCLPSSAHKDAYTQ